MGIPRDDRFGPAAGDSGAGKPKLADGAPCPFCGRDDTELVSPFGGQLSVAQYWCRGCRTGFDYMKWS